MKDYALRWTSTGNLVAEFEGKLMFIVAFFEDFHNVKLTKLEKLDMITKIVERALNTPELAEG